MKADGAGTDLSQVDLERLVGSPVYLPSCLMCLRVAQKLL